MDLETFRGQVELMGRALNAASKSQRRGNFKMVDVFHPCGTPACLAGHILDEVGIVPDSPAFFLVNKPIKAADLIGIPRRWCQPVFQFGPRHKPIGYYDRFFEVCDVAWSEEFDAIHLDRFRRVYWYMRRKLAIMEVESELGTDAPMGKAREQFHKEREAVSV